MAECLLLTRIALLDNNMNDRFFELIYRLSQERRILAVIGSLSALLSFLIFFSDNFSLLLGRTFTFDIQKVSLVFLLISFLSFTLIYLQSGGTNRKDGYYEVNIEIEKEIISNRRKVDSLRAEIEQNRELIKSIRSAHELTAEEREEIISKVTETSGPLAIQQIFEREAEKYRDQLSDSLGVERFGRSAAQIPARLHREIADLRLRSNVNLLLGMGITAGGLYLLWTTVMVVDSSELLKALASEGEETNSKFLKNLLLPMLPRIMLVIFVEVFAYFFLRLYKSGLAEIKYFQNELTNVESKLIAVEFSLLAKNQESLVTSLNSLSTTERNFILEKGQTTVELEKAKSESELTRNVIKNIPAFFKKAKSD